MRIPSVSIRVKILLSLLLVVSTVVGAITFTMARLFHLDKKLYLSDLVSAMTLTSAQEAEGLAVAYRARLETLATVVDASGSSADDKTATLRQLLSQFPGLVAIRFEEAGQELLALYDDQALAEGGMARDGLALAVTRPANADRLSQSGGILIGNATSTAKLPVLSAYVQHARNDGRPPLDVMAVIRLDDFQQIASRSGAIGVFIRDAKGVLLAAGDPTLPARRARTDWVPNLLPGSAAVVREYEGEGKPMTGGLALCRTAGLSAAAEVPSSAAFVASRTLLQRLLSVAFLLLAVTAVAATIAANRITRSIARLADATQAIGRGRFDVNVRIDSRDEIGALASSFNHMAAELDTRERALKTAQAALIQSEKMAAFGQLGAGIAHEVKNPLAGIQGIVQLALTETEDGHPLRESLNIVEKETKRCRMIIDNLLKFARQEKTVHEVTDVAKVVADAAAIMNHQLALHGVTIERGLEADLPATMGNANQLQQVLMNLILNADQAFEGKPGIVRLEAARSAEGGVEIRVRDNGPGIPEDIRARIFEPFFTTKPAGSGTGLGLSVSFGIIKDHGGRIEVDSARGQGTTFRIVLPPAGKGVAIPHEAESAALDKAA